MRFKELKGYPATKVLMRKLIKFKFIKEGSIPWNPFSDNSFDALLSPKDAPLWRLMTYYKNSVMDRKDYVYAIRMPTGPTIPLEFILDEAT